MALARIPAYDAPPVPYDLAAFAAGISGTVIRPDDEGYDAGPPGPQRELRRRPL